MRTRISKPQLVARSSNYSTAMVLSCEDSDSKTTPAVLVNKLSQHWLQHLMDASAKSQWKRKLREHYKLMARANKRKAREQSQAFCAA